MKKLLVAFGIAALSTGAMAQNVGSSIFYNSDNGHYYQMFTNASGLSWDEASTAANGLGGYLATLTSSQENSFIVDNIMSIYNPISNTPGPALYLGATDRVTEGTWQWVTGEAWSYTNWQPGEPNNAYGFDQDFLHIVKTGFYGFNNNWDDGYGDGRIYNGFNQNSNGFIVEWNSNPTAPGNNAVPEPSEWAAMGLLGAGLLGLVVKNRKKSLEAAK
jgi:hypothetical protein